MAKSHTLGEADTSKTYTRLSPTMIIQLAAPHTWPAAILPVLLATTVAVTTTAHLSVTLILALLVICIAMQAAVNTINDYYDFVKGTDTVENQDDPTDAVLVYNNINPRSAFVLALSFLGLAFLLGCYVIYLAGWIPLAIGLVGALIVMLYSAGKSPISYLPIGEYVSGITMGGLIPLACYHALTGSFDPLILLFAVPVMLGIGLIMFTNNTCDIDKDIEAGRKTQSVLLGHRRSVKAYHGVMIVWLIVIVVLIGVFFTRGLVMMPFLLLVVYPTFAALYKNPLTPATRGQAMPQCLSLNVILGVFYPLAILFDSGVMLTF